MRESSSCLKTSLGQLQRKYTSGCLRCYKLTQKSMKCTLVILAALAVFAAASPTGSHEVPKWEAVKAVSDSNLDFTKALFKVISKQPGNLFFSPTSIHVIMGMTSLGARGGTAQEMVQGLRLPSDHQTVKDGFRHLMTSFQRNETVTTKIANKIFTDSQYIPHPDFVQTATSDFHSGSEVVDFQHKYEEARTNINSWVMDHTENKISNLLPQGSVDSSTTMVLVNALYFKGAWEEQFQSYLTAPKPFYVSPDVTKDVPMMYQMSNGDFSYTDSESLNAEILEIPYQGHKVSMMIILPKDKYGLHDVETRLAGMSFRDLMAREVSHPRVKLYLPKFKLEQPSDLTTILQQMGMTKMFSSEADFSGLVSGNKRVQVSKVLHKAFIEVDEEGTEAAAATAVSIQLISERVDIEPRRDITFKADHPFLFVVVNTEYIPGGFSHHKTVLFMGRYSQPA